MSEPANTPAENPSDAWPRYVAAMKALTGIEPDKGDSLARYNFRIWQIGYLAGVTDSENRRRIGR